VLSYVYQNKSFHQRGAFIMTLKTGNFQININEDKTFTSMGGALLISGFFRKFGIDSIIDENIGARIKNSARTYTDSSYIKSLVTMQLLGGETVDDLNALRGNKALSGIIGVIPGHTSVHNYIESFADKTEEAKRGQGKSFIPEPTNYLKGFDKVTRYMLSRASHIKDISTVTFDQDATFIETGVSGALYNYKSERAFEAFNTYCPEYDMMIKSEYRDGNVPPGFRQMENLAEALELLPEGVRHVKLRSDTAGYQIELLKYCAEGRNERFGVIDFAISSPVGKALKEAVRAAPEGEWRKISPDSAQECAEIVFVPNALATSKKAPEYRFIATREELRDIRDPDLLQKLLFEDEDIPDSPLSAVHPAVMNGRVYKVFALVTNMAGAPEEIVRWQRERCGKSEEAHRIIKSKLAGGHVVTSSLGANAAWWQISVLAFNIQSMIKRVCLPEEYWRARPKKLRYQLFSLVARVGSHARITTITLYRSFQAMLFKMAWKMLNNLSIQLE
jgi:hypothetical protein